MSLELQICSEMKKVELKRRQIKSNMAVVLVWLCWLVSAMAHCVPGTRDEDAESWQDFKQKHNKNYSDVEEAQRFEIFRASLIACDKLNEANRNASGNGLVYGITKFMDLTYAEFKENILMNDGSYTAPTSFGVDVNLPSKRMRRGILSELREYRPAIPLRRRLANSSDIVDWRNEGVVTPVKDQGRCGACWSFSATEATESFGALAGILQKQTQLSASQVCSCTMSNLPAGEQTANPNGCNGGNPQEGYLYGIQAENGIEGAVEDQYNGQCTTCTANASCLKYINTQGYHQAQQGQLQKVLENYGPPSVAVAAQSWQYYTGGIMQTCDTSGGIDHAVQAVGYNLNTANPTEGAYWIVRNQWGTDWGEGGYIYLSMTADSGNICLINTDVNFPNVVAVPSSAQTGNVQCSSQVPPLSSTTPAPTLQQEIYDVRIPLAIGLTLGFAFLVCVVFFIANPEYLSCCLPERCLPTPKRAVAPAEEAEYFEAKVLVESVGVIVKVRFIEDELHVM
eukprot:g58099.t1